MFLSVILSIVFLQDSSMCHKIVNRSVLKLYKLWLGKKGVVYNATKIILIILRSIFNRPHNNIAYYSDEHTVKTVFRTLEVRKSF